MEFIPILLGWFIEAGLAFLVLLVFFRFGLSSVYSTKEKCMRALWLKVSSTPFLWSIDRWFSLLSVHEDLQKAAIDSTVLMTVVFWLAVNLFEAPLFWLVAPKQNYPRKDLFRDLRTLAVANTVLTMALIGVFHYGALIGSLQKLYDCFSDAHSNEVTSLAFNTDGNTLASISADHTLKLWDVASGRSTQTYQLDENYNSDAFFSRDLKLAALYYAGEVQLFDLKAGKVLYKIISPDSRVAFNPAGTLFATNANPSITLWNAKNGAKVRTIGPDLSQSPMLFSSDGQMLLSRMDINNGTLEYPKLVKWNVETGAMVGQVCSFPSFTSAVYGMQPENNTVIIGDNEQVLLVDLTNGKTLKKCTTKDRYCTSRDGRRIAFYGHDEIHIQDLQNFVPLRTISSPRVDSPAALSPDGRLLATAGENYSIKIWDTETGRLVRNIEHPLLPTADEHSH